MNKKLKIRGQVCLTVSLIMLTLCIVFASVLTIVAERLSEDGVQKQLSISLKYAEYVIDTKYEGDFEVADNLLSKGKVILNNSYLLNVLKGETGYEYTLFVGDTRINTTIKDTSLIGTKAGDKIRDIVLTEGKVFRDEIELSGVTYDAMYIPIKDKKGKAIGMLFAGRDKTQLLINLLGAKEVFWGMSFIITIIAYGIVAIRVKKITNRIDKVKQHLLLLRDGDFTTTVNEKLLIRQDEVGELTSSFKIMQKTIVELLKEVNDVTKNVNKRAENLSIVSNKMLDTSQNVTASIQEVTGSVTSQAADLVNINEAVGELGNSIEKVSRGIESIERRSTLIATKSQGSNCKMQEVEKSITQLTTIFKVYMRSVKNLEKRVEQINQITALIHHVAEQTNLLALNAAIEAARTGESGKGFSVVADEIRKLAEQSKCSVASIGELITGISQDTKVIIEQTVVMEKGLDEQGSKVNQTVGDFHEIIQVVNEIATKIKQINEAVQGVNTEKEVIIEKIESASSIAEEISASCQQVSSVTEDMYTCSDTTAHTSMRLEKVAKELEMKVQSFKIKEEGVTIQG